MRGSNAIAPAMCTSQKENRGAFNCDARESSRLPCAGVDVDSIVSDIGVRHRCVTVHDEVSVVLRGVEELLSYPDQVVGILMIDGNVRTNARVNEQKIAAAELISQALHEQFVRTRKGVEKAAMQVGGGFGSVVQLDAIGRERLHAAQLKPVLEDGRLLKESFHHSFVVASQTHRAIPNKPYREQIDHRPGIWPAIDIVAEIHFNRACDRPAPDIVVDARCYVTQQVGAAVNIADGIDARTCRRRSGNGT